MLMQTLQSSFTKYWIFGVGKKIYRRLGKSEYHNRFFPFTLRRTFSFPCLVICLTF